jgi:hypothetical protein
MRAPGWTRATRATTAILLDAYRQPYIPFYLLTHEFFESVRAHLRRGGVLIVNVGHLPDSDALEQVVTATARSVFPSLARDPVSDTNSLVVTGTDPLSADRLMRTSELRAPPALNTLAVTVASRLTTPLRGGAVYTDDRAPVEWLTDLSIAQYAFSR